MKSNPFLSLIGRSILLFTTLSTVAFSQEIKPLTSLPSDYPAVTNVAAENDVIIVDAWKNWRESDTFISKDAGTSFAPIKKFPQWGRALKDGDKLYYYDSEGISRVNAAGELEEPLEIWDYVDTDSVKIHDGIAYGFNRGTVYIMEKGKEKVAIETGVRQLYELEFMGNTLVLTSTSGIVVIPELGRGKVTTFLHASEIFMEYTRKLLAADGKLYAANDFGDIYVLSQASIEAGHPEMIKHIEGSGGCTSMLAFNGKIYINDFGFGFDQPSKTMTTINAETLEIESAPFRNFRVLTSNGSYLLGGDNDGLSQIQ